MIDVTDSDCNCPKGVNIYIFRRCCHAMVVKAKAEIEPFSYIDWKGDKVWGSGKMMMFPGTEFPPWVWGDNVEIIEQSETGLIRREACADPNNGGEFYFYPHSVYDYGKAPSLEEKLKDLRQSRRLIG